MDKPENPPLLAMPNYTGGDCVTLRDYFAAAALQGFLASQEGYGGWDRYAIDAYEMADSMLAARQGGGQ